MHRRRLLSLAALSIAVSGCIADENDTTEPNNDDTDDNTDDDSNDDDPVNTEPQGRVDEPPHRIERLDDPDDVSEEDQWNPDYLGEHMATEPSLAFESISTSRGELPGFEMSEGTGAEYRGDLVASESELDDLIDWDELGEETRERLEAVNFETAVLVYVRSGWGSGSRQHRWKRAHEIDGGIHLHGYYTDPYIQTDDYTWRASLLEIARPETEVDRVQMSITVSEDQRVNFDTTEGLVRLED